MQDQDEVWGWNPQEVIRGGGFCWPEWLHTSRLERAYFWCEGGGELSVGTFPLLHTPPTLSLVPLIYVRSPIEIYYGFSRYSCGDRDKPKHP